MAITTPIKSTSTLKLAFKWLDKNVDPAFALMYRLGNTTGLRITDITEIEWSNINFDEKTITITENKGTRAARSRARLKILECWKTRLFQMEKGNTDLMESLYTTKTTNLMAVVPERYLSMITDEVNAAMAASKDKTRTVDLHPSLISPLRARMNKYQSIDSGFVFARSTFKSNRAKNTDGVISRQACWKVFSAMGDAITSIAEKVKGSCHGMRKTFARMLYSNNNNDLNLVMQVMGWSNVAMVMRYLGFDTEQRQEAAGNVFNNLAF